MLCVRQLTTGIHLHLSACEYPGLISLLSCYFPVKLQKQLLNLLFLSQGYAGANCERTMNCKELPCYNGGSCTLTSRGARCTCIQGFGGPLCQHRSNQGCYLQTLPQWRLVYRGNQLSFFPLPVHQWLERHTMRTGNQGATTSSSLPYF